MSDGKGSLRIWQVLMNTELYSIMKKEFEVFVITYVIYRIFIPLPTLSKLLNKSNPKSKIMLSKVVTPYNTPTAK